MVRLRRGSPDRRDALAIGLIGLHWVVMSLAVNPIGDFPLNDDWLYGGTVKALLAGDGFHVPGAVRGPTIANFLSQAVWGAAFCLPFGFSFTALRVSTLVLGFIGLAFFFALVRENGGNRRIAAAATLTIAVNPFWFGLAESFMTDVPFVALMIVSIYFLARSLRIDSTSSLIAGIIVSFAAILLKQVGFAPLLGFAVANAVKHRFRVRPSLAGVLPLVLGCVLHFGFRDWVLSTGRGSFIAAQIIPLEPGSLISWSGHVALWALPYVGLSLVPIVAMTGVLPRAIRGTRAAAIAWVCVGAFIVAGTSLLWSKGDLIPSLSNIFNDFGMGPLTQRDTYLLHLNLPPVTDWTAGFWIGVTAYGLLGIVALFTVGVAGLFPRAAALWRGRTDGNDWLWVMAAVTGIGYWTAIVLLATQTGEFFDRYVLPVVPIALILMVVGARESPVRRGGLTGAILIVMGGLSVAAAHDYLAWNRTRWTAVRELTGRLGVAPADIDGGYEVNGSLMYRPGFFSPPGTSWWWVGQDDYVLASGPLQGYREIMRYPITGKLLPVGLRQIVILRRDR
jgi:hypothetical protein